MERFFLRDAVKLQIAGSRAIKTETSKNAPALAAAPGWRLQQAGAGESVRQGWAPARSQKQLPGAEEPSSQAVNS